MSQQHTTWPRPFSTRVLTPVTERQLLDGKYLIERPIGSGGMAVVVAATHIHLEQRVAIKFLQPHAADDVASVARFAREARALAKIESEHVARVIDVGTLRSGQPYMVLECLVGGTLADLLEVRGALDVGEAVTYVLEACEAIAEAHALGIVHRDLKPENLFLADRAGGARTIKVIDFGISKMSSDTELSREVVSAMAMEESSAMLGSPPYMSPEQFGGAEIGPASDIWSLGVTIYELLTRERPFRGRTMPELFAAILRDPPRPLRHIRPDVPVALEAIVMRCLEKDPARRPADIAELAGALSPFGGADAERSRRRAELVLRSVWPRDIASASQIDIQVNRLVDPLPSPAAQSPPRRATRTRWSGRRKTVLAAACILALGVAATAMQARGKDAGRRVARPVGTEALP